jgi:hypothetical protein
VLKIYVCSMMLCWESGFGVGFRRGILCENLFYFQSMVSLWVFSLRVGMELLIGGGTFVHFMILRVRGIQIYCFKTSKKW